MQPPSCRQSGSGQRNFTALVLPSTSTTIIKTRLGAKSRRSKNTHLTSLQLAPRHVRKLGPPGPTLPRIAGRPGIARQVFPKDCQGHTWPAMSAGIPAVTSPCHAPDDGGHRAASVKTDQPNWRRGDHDAPPL
jgi:hypothetical protein